MLLILKLALKQQNNLKLKYWRLIAYDTSSISHYLNKNTSTDLSPYVVYILIA